MDWTVKATLSSQTLEPWAAAVLAVPERRAGQLNARYLKVEAEREHNDACSQCELWYDTGEGSLSDRAVQALKIVLNLAWIYQMTLAVVSLHDVYLGSTYIIALKQEQMQLQASHHALNSTVKPNAAAYSKFDEPDAVSVEACWLT